MSKDVAFNIKLSIDGKEHIVTASTNVKQLAREMEIAQTEATKFRDKLLTFNQIGQSFQNALSGLQQLTGLMQTYTAANAAQSEAEAKLANNMRNTMGARDEDVQSIKDLCAAQQQLGVIGDEVQLAGAQELATYLEKKSSLEKLIPVMNDMVAQQYGLNATQESAANIATMLGKVMDGQVGALSRYGYKFDEAQEQILKFGTEEQRAAVLAEVVESAVGGANAELAKTDAGKAKQAANDFGDLKERIGAIVAPLEDDIIKFGQLSLAINAIGTSWQGLRGLYAFIVNLGAATKTSTVATLAQAAASKVAAAAQSLWTLQLRYGTQAQLAWTFGAKLATVQAIAMRAAILGLMAVTGVGIAVAAVAGIVSLFASKIDDSTDSMKDANREAKNVEEHAKRLQDVEQATTDAYTNASSTLEINKEKLKNLIAAKNIGKDVSKEEKKIVGQLNDTYGDTMGYFSSVSQWYDALVANSEAYCRQMVIEAKTRALANQIAEKEADIHNTIYDEKGNKRKYSTKRDKKTVYHVKDSGSYAKRNIQTEQVEVVGSSDIEKANQKIRDGREVITDLQNQMRNAVKEASQLNFRVKGSPIRPTTKPTGGNHNGTDDADNEKKLIENANTYKELANNVAYYQQELEKCDITDTERILTLARAKKATEDAIRALKDMADVVNVPVDLKTLDDYDKKLQTLRNQRKTANKEAIAQIDAEIEKTEDLRAVMDGMPKETVKLARALKNAQKELEQATTVEAKVAASAKVAEIQQQIDQQTRGQLTIEAEVEPTYIKTGSDADKRQSHANAQQKATRIQQDYEIGLIGANEALEQLAELNLMLEKLGLKPVEVSVMTEDIDKAKTKFQAATDSIAAMGQSFASLGSALELPELNIAGTLAQAIATMTQGYATATTQAATMGPWAWIAFAATGLAQLVAMISTVKQATAFADGGVVSGPTYALVGEYAGATNNPEVIAPLDKLRSMIQPQGGIGGTVRFEIDGRKLVGVIANETRISSKSGKRTNIKV